MARLVITLALFVLFTPSQSLPQPDPNPRDDLLLLPSDNSLSGLPDDSLSSTAVADPKSSVEDPESNRVGFVSLPLTKLDFHEGSIPLSLRFPHRRHFGRGFRRGFMRRRGRQGMRPHQISYGNDMILSDGKDASQEFVRRSRFEVSAPWKGEEEGVFQRPKVFEHGLDVEDEDMFKRPKKFKRGHHDENDNDEDEMFKRPKKFKRGHRDEDVDDEDEMFKRPPKKFRHHDDEDDVFKRPKKFDDDDEFRPLETVSKVKHEDDNLAFRMPRKFDHWDDDHDDDWHREKKHHHRRFGHHHHKHRHDDDDDDNKGGVISKMKKFFDDLF